MTIASALPCPHSPPQRWPSRPSTCSRAFTRTDVHTETQAQTWALPPWLGPLRKCGLPLTCQCGGAARAPSFHQWALFCRFLPRSSIPSVTTPHTMAIQPEPTPFQQGLVEGTLLSLSTGSPQNSFCRTSIQALRGQAALPLSPDPLLGRDRPREHQSSGMTGPGRWGAEESPHVRPQGEDKGCPRWDRSSSAGKARPSACGTVGLGVRTWSWRRNRSWKPCWPLGRLFVMGR